jgi:hypothetical protein
MTNTQTPDDDSSRPAANAPSSDVDEFVSAAQEKPPGLLAEYWDFLIHNKKWWLTPIVIILLVLSLLVILAGTVGPFIYPFI